MAPILLADLDRCRPNARLRRTLDPGCWRVLPYRADSIPDGRMLGAGETSEAGAVAYPLEREGWFRISIGIFNGFWRPYREQRLEVRLAGDRTWSTLVLPPPSDLPWGIPLDDDRLGPRITEVAWRTVELHGQALELRQPRAMPLSDQTAAAVGSAVYVAYLRLDALSAAEVDAVRGDRARTDTKRLFAYDDTWNPFFEHPRPMTAEEGAEAIRTQMEPYRGTDFERIYWEGAHGDVCHYPTRVGRTWDAFASGSWPRAGDRNVVETWKLWRAAGFDPLAEAIDAAHDAGLEIHATYRLGWGAFYWPPPFDAYNAGGLFDSHPEWRCVRRDGSADTALSFAFPGVRAFAVRLLAELATYPVDGLALLFNRQPPFVGYEAPVLESFRAETGGDALTLPHGDEAWLLHRARSLTAFLEELRAAVPALPVTAWVFGTREENLDYGLDVPAWVQRGLVDTVVPYSSQPKGFSWGQAWSDPDAIAAWLDTVRDTPVRLAPNVMPRDMSDDEHRQQALRLYGAGAHALSFWDTSGRRSLWSGTLARLGHEDELRQWWSGDTLPRAWQSRRIFEVAGWRFEHLPE